MVLFSLLVQTDEDVIKVGIHDGFKALVIGFAIDKRDYQRSPAIIFAAGISFLLINVRI